MIFLTVGTQFPFDRLVRAVDDIFDEGLIDEEIFAQIGESSYKPRNFKSVAFLDKEVFDKHVKEASAIISHAGTGSIIMALDHNKPLLVMARLKQYKEHVNDHQVAIAKKFARSGHILAVYKVEDMQTNIKKLTTFVPRKRDAEPDAVAKHIMRFLSELSAIKSNWAH